MKKVNRKIARQIYFVNFGIMIGFGIFIAPIIGLCLGIFLASDFWVGFWAGLIGYLFVFGFFAYLSASRRIKKINHAYEYMSNAVKNKLEKADYYNSGEYGAIAVDAKNKAISVISADQKFNFSEPFVFNSDKIRNFKSFKPELRTSDTSVSTPNISVSTSGISVSTSGTSRRDVYEDHEIAEANAKAHRETGIYIYLDDLTKPQIIVQMEYSEAEKWLLILEKLLEGSLEEQSSPMAFPQT
uniref:Uncharacterized protein n=1 Tax=Candidatus Kentrum sp. LFY TaxID=2126342 RepID=A0A450WL49_9GAMM|nr:MAG: hypothetical protein BECKLFY1418C_GA0070996_103525 [Candidatus Kentron sp. LFY]